MNASPLPDVSIPVGGTIDGYGETFAASSFSGTGSFSIPIYVSPGRQPLELTLDYTSGGGNGPFAMGWDLALASVARRTDRGIPRYDDRDSFVYGSDEIVPELEETSGGWLPVIRDETRDGIAYQVHRYRPRVEVNFTRVERWISPSNEFWKTTSSDGVATFYGTDVTARIADPSDPTRIFRWLIAETLDLHGNRVVFQYKKEDDANAIRNVGDAGRSYTANRYLEKILYGNYADANGDEGFAFEVIFDYGEYDPLSGSTQPVRVWPARLDCFSVYRSGFEVRTCRLCRGVMMVNVFPAELGQPRVITYTSFQYDEQETGSMLVRTQRTGLRTEAGVVRTRAMPPIDLEYSGFHPERQRFQRMAVDGAPVPGILDGALYRLVDLNGEGLPGVLYTDGATMLYWPPLGNGRYAAPRPLPILPIEHFIDTSSYALVDLDSNGHLDLVVAEATRAGFYRNDDPGWSPYRDFTTWPPEYVQPQSQLVDLNGNGLADVYVQAGSATRYYESLGTEGFAMPVVVGPSPGLPSPSAASERIAIFFDDIFGDGLSHRVMVSDGNVVAWPNLGYGRFADPVIFANAPQWGANLTANRIFLADVTGDGGSDLLLVYPNHLELYPNASGNGFGAMVRIDVPFVIDALDQINLADVLGNGTASMVISKAGTTVEHFYFNFSGGVRYAYLLSMRNNVGLRTDLSYRSSTEYYLRDAEIGQPWVTRLSTPVYVLESVTTVDEIAGSETVRTYQYRDGYFDPVERQFRGFGYVQTQDTLVQAPTVWHFPNAGSRGTPPDVQPALTRAWHLTGAYMQGRDIEAQARSEYWHGDPDALRLPASVREPQIFTMNAATIREAYVALADHLAHQEIFGVRDDGSLAVAPLTVQESSYYVELLQPRHAGRPAVFHVYERENATSRYDGVADDPRIEHELTLEVGPYGFENRTARVAYGRRANALSQQSVLLATVTLARPIDLVDNTTYLVNEEYWNQLLELSGVAPQGRYFAYAEMAAQAQLALDDTIAFGVPFTSGATQARLTTWSTTYFWDAARTAPLPLGFLSIPPLIHHAEEAVFTPEVVDVVYGGRVAEAMLTAAQYRFDGTYWWSLGNTLYYFDAGGYYLLQASTDPFGNTASNTYDAYWLSIVTMTDALGQVVTVWTDYQANEPWQVQDVNDNFTQAIYDPLGLVTVASITARKNGIDSGNMNVADYIPRALPTFAEVIDNSSDYLQGASSYFYYSLDSWKDPAPQPPHTVTLLRQDFYFDENGQPLPDTPIRKTVTYADGSTRQLCAKTAVESSATDVLELPSGAGDIVWVESARLVYDDRGDVIRRYLSELTTTPRYERTVTAPFFRYHYDALHRLIRTDTPKGFLTKTEYASWSSTYWDEDDTVLESPFYVANQNNHDPAFAPELAALEKAAVFSDTPMTTSLNPLGFPVQILRRNVYQDGLVIVRQDLHESFWVDIKGQVLRAADARFYDPANPPVPFHLSATNEYDMPGDALRSWTCDAGTRFTLRDTLGAIIDTWDERGYRVTTTYDALRRVIRSAVFGNGLDQIFERVTYGTDPATNTCNQIVQRDDPSGVGTFPQYDILGYAIAATRRFVADYKSTVNWNVPADVKLMPETWMLAWTHNAAGQTTETKNADGTITRQQFWVNGWLKSTTLETPEGPTPAGVVDLIRYNAQSESTHYVFGNGVVSDYVYDPKDYRPIAIDSTAPGGVMLQKVRTTYDPVGNVVSIEDHFVPPGFAPFDVEPTNDFTYDAIYQLRLAAGREQANPGAQDFARYNDTYSYDLGSNLVTLQHAVPSDPLADRLREVVVSDNSNRAVPKSMIVGGKKPDDFFDVCGNQLALESLQAMAWDFRNALSKVVIDSDGATEYYVNEGPAERSRKVIERPGTGGDSEFVDTLYIENTIIVMSGTIDGDTTDITSVAHTTCVHAGDELVLVTTKSIEPDEARAWRWQLLSPVHSVVLETNELAALVTFEEFFPFGSTSAESGQQVDLEEKRYRFTSKERDEATDLYSMGARYYISWIGRWTSPDPAGARDGLNLYAYVRNNPTSMIDPDGLNGTPDPRTKPLPIYSLSQSTAELAQLYGYVSSTHQEYYSELTTRMQQSIYLRPDLTSSSSTSHFHPEVERELWDVLEMHRGVHVASVPGLMDKWTDVVSNYSGAKTGSALYSAMRSKFTPELNAIPVVNFKDAQFIRPPELHHLIYKSIRPEYAVQPWNLMLATRGSSSSGLVGSHEGIFHKLGSAGDSNLYSVLNPAFERLVLSWAGQTPSFFPAPVFSSAPSSIDQIVQTYSSARLWSATTTTTSSTLSTAVVSVPSTSVSAAASSTPSIASHIPKTSAKRSRGSITKSKNAPITTPIKKRRKGRRTYGRR